MPPSCHLLFTFIHILLHLSILLGHPFMQLLLQSNISIYSCIY